MPDSSSLYLTDNIILMFIGVYEFAVGLTDILSLVLSQRVHSRDEPKGRVTLLHVETQLDIDIVRDGVVIRLMVL